MKKTYTYNDILIVPKYSVIETREKCNTRTELFNKKFNLGIISSNMDTVTEDIMANAMYDNGALGALHRFQSIESNIEMFKKCKGIALTSVGVGKKELERFEALYDAGSNYFLVDIAHGASLNMVDMVKEMRNLKGYGFNLIIGNFATSQGIDDINLYLNDYRIDAYKVGIGSGSACTTREVTGCGYPSFSSLQSCVSTGLPIIADGGHKNTGDICKAFALGAKAIMLGGMLAGTNESPSETIFDSSAHTGEYCTVDMVPKYKKYRGSASLESYKVQGKVSEHRTPEGESFYIPYVGSVKDVLQNISAALKSSMSYVGAKNLNEFKKYSEFVVITNNGTIENKAHGK